MFCYIASGVPAAPLAQLLQGQEKKNSCDTAHNDRSVAVDSGRSPGYRYSMSTTIRLAFLSRDYVSQLWTDDEDLTDCEADIDAASFAFHTAYEAVGDDVFLPWDMFNA